MGKQRTTTAIRRRPIPALLLACALTISAGRALADAGSLDPDFGGGDGKVSVRLTPGGGYANGVAVQPDGKIVAAGRAGDGNTDFGVARFTPHGALDTTFGGDGAVVTSVSPRIDEAFSVALQADGKIVLAGGAGGLARFALVRYKPNGDLDPTFGGDGIVTTTLFDGSGGFATSVAMQPDGKIVAAGSTGTRFALARYRSNGRLDDTFGGDGKVTTNFSPNADAANAVAIQADGKIVAAGFANYFAKFALARYRIDGSLDPTFGTDGRVTTEFTGGGKDGANAVAVEPDGTIVAAGFANFFHTFGLARYHADGTLDRGFGGDGRVTTEFTNGQEDAAFAVAVQADGRIVAAGAAGDFDRRFALARYHVDGTLDRSFDGDGRVTTNFTLDKADAAFGVALQADGKIVAAGPANNGDRLAVVRYLAT